jgi:hypothetical protein
LTILIAGAVDLDLYQREKWERDSERKSEPSLPAIGGNRKMKMKDFKKMTRQEYDAYWASSGAAGII